MNKMLLVTVFIGLFFFVISIAHSSHSIKVCNDTIVCGVSDGICPEDIPGFGTCDVPDPDCGAQPHGPSAPSSLIGPNYVYNCTPKGEIDTFTKVINRSIYSIDGYCLNLRVQNSIVKDNPESAILKIFLKKIKVTGLSFIGGYNVSSTTEIENATFNVRVSKLWEEGVIKRTISLYDLKGNRYNLTKIGEDKSYDYYKTNVNSFGIFYIGAKKRPTIWYVIHEIDLYYSHKVSFANVIRAILDYYGE